MFGVIAYVRGPVSATLRGHTQTHVGLSRVDLVDEAEDVRIVVENIEACVAKGHIREQRGDARNKPT